MEHCYPSSRPEDAIEEVVKKALLDEHADVVREAVEAVAAETMELEVSALIGAELGGRRRARTALAPSAAAAPGTTGSSRPGRSTVSSAAR